MWVTDLNSGEPLEGVGVTLYAENGLALATGASDADGLLRVRDKKVQTDRIVYAVAESESVYGVWSAWSSGRPGDFASYLYTDRPIYRPGETLYFRGALRHKDDMTYSLPRGELVDVRVMSGYGGTLLFEARCRSAVRDVQRRDRPAGRRRAGQGWIEVRYQSDYLGQIGFTLAEFRVPEYRVEVTPDTDALIQGDPLRATIAASYYFGGPVSNTAMTWNIWANRRGSTTPGRAATPSATRRRISTGASISAAPPRKPTAPGGSSRRRPTHRAPAIYPMTITVEGQVADESGQYIAGRTTLLAHPAEVYVGQRTDRIFGRADQPLTVDLIAVTPDSAPIAGQRIDVTVTELRWERTPAAKALGSMTGNCTRSRPRPNA